MDNAEIHKEIATLRTLLGDGERICYCIATLLTHNVAGMLCCDEVGLYDLCTVHLLAKKKRIFTHLFV